jgi:hypothetical protein
MNHRKLALGALVAAAFVATPAGGSVSIELSIDEVARGAAIVARVIPLDAASAWEDGRIVTTTRVRIERVVAGSSPGGEIRIKTLGGIVGNVGQSVAGEAAFVSGTPSIVCLTTRGGAHVVVARAQGQLVVRHANGEQVFAPDAGHLLRRPFRPPQVQLPTMRTLDGAPEAQATETLARAWERTHAR